MSSAPYPWSTRACHGWAALDPAFPNAAGQPGRLIRGSRHGIALRDLRFSDRLDPELSDFTAIAERLHLPGWPAVLDTEYLPAPHKPKALRNGYGAIYVFTLTDDAAAPGGESRVLKVGRVGHNSNARFQSQHYSPSLSRSNLAKSILEYPALWPWLGISNLDSATVREWMLTHLDRANVYVPESSAGLRPHLEMYVRARLGGSVYEGSA